MLGLQETHGEEDEFGLDDFGFSSFNHDGTTTVGVGFPVDGLDAYTCDMTVLAKELKGVDVPSTGAAFLVRRGGLEDDWPIGPRCGGVVSHRWLGHDLNLRDRFGSLTMGSAYAVGTRVTTTDDEYVLALSRYALILREFHACQHAVLLREEFEG